MGGKLEILEKLNSDKFLLGYDLGNRFSQISFCPMTEKEPETLSTVAGQELFNIPTVLCKRKGVNQWFYGKEAYKYQEENDGILVENLVELAQKGEKIQLDEQEYDPVALLALFVKRSLALFAQVASYDRIGGLMFTCDELDRNLVEILSTVVMGLGLKTGNVCFQGHVESIYSFMIYQEKTLWNQQVLVCEYLDSGMKVYRMECNKRTTPVVVFIDVTHHLFPYPRQQAYEEMDRKFLEILEEECEGRLISSIYFIGEGFQGEWMQESLKFACRNRRVFQGNNLYSKGACYAMLERQQSSEEGKAHVFLGNEKLKSNIGMKVSRRGEDSYLALLDAGSNWFETQNKVEFFLEEGDSFEILITPLNGKNVTCVEMKLPGLPVRPKGCTRLSLQVDMISETKVQLRIEDLGFGEIFPSSQQKWKEIFEV